jgi:hypothetical protein
MKEVTLEQEVKIDISYYEIGYRFSFKTAIEIIQGKYKLAITELEKIMEVEPSESVLNTLNKYKEMYIIASNLYNPKIHK